MEARPRYFFEIPVYRCSEEQNDKDIDRERINYLWAAISNTYELRGLTKADFIKERIKKEQSDSGHVSSWIEDHFFEGYCVPWRYNQAIGWIRIYVLGTQIRGEYYFVNVKRIRRRLRHKCVFWQGTAFEMHTYPEMSSSDIYLGLLEELKKVARDRPFKRHFLDLESLEGIGSCVDWRLLAGHS